MGREARSLGFKLGIALGVVVLAGELFLALARPIFLVSVLATVIILVAFVWAVAGRRAAAELIVGVALVALGVELFLSFSRPIYVLSALATAVILVAFVWAVAGRRSATQAIVAVIVVIVAVYTAGVAKLTSPPVIGVLNGPLAQAQKAVRLPPTDVTLTLSLDASAGLWRADTVTLGVRARPRGGQKHRITRALAAIGWTVLPRRIGADGQVYLRLQRPVSMHLIAHLPTVTDWTPSTTIPLGVPATFPLGANSRVVVTAPSGLLGSTEPAALETSPVPGSNSATTVVAFDFNTLAVGVTLEGWVQRHPALRSAVAIFLPVLLPSGLAVSLFTWLRRRRRRDGDSDGTGSGPPERDRTTGPARDTRPSASVFDIEAEIGASAGTGRARQQADAVPAPHRRAERAPSSTDDLTDIRPRPANASTEAHRRTELAPPPLDEDGDIAERRAVEQPAPDQGQPRGNRQPPGRPQPPRV